MRARLLTLFLAVGIAFSQTSCLKKIIFDGQVSATRKGAGGLDTVADYELARIAASAGLAQFEGMHRLGPNNTDALFLLTKSWVSYGYAFCEDDYDAAVDKGDDDMAEYQKRRARMAYERSVFYGLELLGHSADGFDAAKKNEETFKAWLDKNFDDKEDVEPLFWTGYAWLARVNIGKDDPALVGELFVGIAMLEKARQLDESYNHYSVLTALAAYHARTAMSEMDEAQKLFEDALTKTEHKTLLVQVNYATRWACNKGDKALYDKLLNEVLAADDPDPQQRLTNAVAKRRAKRALTKVRMDNCSF